jgi:hypothetical protein
MISSEQQRKCYEAKSLTVLISSKLVLTSHDACLVSEASRMSSDTLTSNTQLFIVLITDDAHVSHLRKQVIIYDYVTLQTLEP